MKKGLLKTFLTGVSACLKVSFGQIEAALLIVCVLTAGMAVSSYASDKLTDQRIEVVVPPGADYMVIDEMDGVEARYRAMDNSDIYGEYSCAGFVKTYYQAVYGVNVLNLMDEGPPSPSELFIQPDTPQKGDIIFYASPPNSNNHNAIVKSFDGRRITLIEQSFKWAEAGGTYTYLNRTIPFPPEADEPYEIWRLRDAPVITQAETEEVNESGEPEESGAGQDEEELPEEIGAEQDDSSSKTKDDEETVPAFAEDNGNIPYTDGYIDNPVPPRPEGLSPELPWPPIDEGPSEALTPPTDAEPAEPLLPLPEDPNEPPETKDNVSIPREVVVTLGRPSITINGAEVSTDAPAIAENGRMLMPVRWVGYAMGLNENDIQWSESQRLVTVYHTGGTIRFVIDYPQLMLDDRTITMDCPAALRNGRAYIPVKYLAEALGVFYLWDPVSASVTFYPS